MPKSERILLWATAVATAVLRALAYFRYRFDSDEQQHLHVVWGWTAGLVQYRDLFDNHSPLFHLLAAPMLSALGERPDILLWMRAPMLVLFAVVLGATWSLARRLYDRETAVTAVLLLAAFPPFALKSLEFRPDNLWNALWMLALVVLAGGLAPARLFVAGLLMGGALAASLKTSLLLVALGISAVIVWRFAMRSQRVHALAVIPFLAGLFIVPASLAIWFASLGAWRAMLYCTVTFNATLARIRPELWIARAAFPFVLAGVVWLAWRLRRDGRPWRTFLLVLCGTYTAVLVGAWLLISPRDFLPLMPILAIFGAAVIRSAEKPAMTFLCVMLVCIASLWYYAEGFVNRTAWHTTMLEQALRLTRPGEPIADIKGETIYRPRPFYYALEVVTRAQMASGIISDTIAADVVRTGTHVAQADGPLWPPAARAFLSANFLNMGRLRASGQWIRQDGSFSIAVPGEYVILNERGEARGLLDGSPNLGARELGPGRHRFEPEAAGETLAVLWAPAWRRGHSPFHLRDLEF